MLVLTWLSWRTETIRNICYGVLLQKRKFIRKTHKHESNTFSNT